MYRAKGTLAAKPLLAIYDLFLRRRYTVISQSAPLSLSWVGGWVWLFTFEL